ncbi:hypothetical protein Btru_061969 [Bulinus truncatus]|nr:hypothetical protein Btru_061969 [Bulinus truncatus]
MGNTIPLANNSVNGQHYSIGKQVSMGNTIPLANKCQWATLFHWQTSVNGQHYSIGKQQCQWATLFHWQTTVSMGNTIPLANSSVNGQHYFIGKQVSMGNTIPLANKCQWATLFHWQTTVSMGNTIPLANNSVNGQHYSIGKQQCQWATLFHWQTTVSMGNTIPLANKCQWDLLISHCALGSDSEKEDDINISLSILSGDRLSGHWKQIAGNGDDNNNGDDDEEDGDTTDGGDPLILESSKSHIENAGAKRKHIQSRRMQEYQQQLTTNSSNRQERKCTVCGRILTSGPGFRYHVRIHSENNESFTCDMCNKSFKSANGLKYHKKRKRCRGGHAHSLATGSSVTSESSSKLEPSSESQANERLMELATIATGPQSPLLHCQSSGGRSSSASSFFNDSETSAVMALSSMKKKRELKKISDKPPSGPHPPESQKPKRPMNGFMLFAQRYRAEFNKKYPDLNNRMISIKLSEEWNRLQDHERLKWKEEARLKAEQHQKVYPNCWKRKK